MATIYNRTPSVLDIRFMKHDEEADFWHFLDGLLVDPEYFAVSNMDELEEEFRHNDYKELILAFASVVTKDDRTYEVQVDSQNQIESISPSKHTGEPPHVIGIKVNSGVYRYKDNSGASTENVKPTKSEYKDGRRVNVDRLHTQDNLARPFWDTTQTDSGYEVLVEEELTDANLTKYGIETERWTIEVEELPVNDPSEYTDLETNNYVTTISY